MVSISQITSSISRTMHVPKSVTYLAPVISNLYIFSAFWGNCIILHPIAQKFLQSNSVYGGISLPLKVLPRRNVLNCFGRIEFYTVGHKNHSEPIIPRDFPLLQGCLDLKPKSGQQRQLLRADER